MPFELFDRNKLKLLPLSQRVNDLDAGSIYNEPVPAFNHPALDNAAEAILRAKKRGASVIMMYGAHVIRRGLGPLMVRLMEEGYITHFATNGAGAIHDFELAMAGGTCESVARYISEGQFGLWEETGRLNAAASGGARDNIGFGEAAGRYITENNFPHAASSVLAAGYRLQIPVTVHIGIGSDIIHEHPSADGAAIGQTSMTDFLIFANSMERLEGGVFLNFGSAVTGPEVYLKCLAMARNAAKQENRRVTDFTTAVFDVLPIEENYVSAPPKSDPRYYFRPWKTILARTVADGGRSYYIQGEHRATFGNLALKLLNKR